MLKKGSRLLSFILSASLVTTTFGSDMATARVYAVEDEIAAESSDQSDDDSISNLSFAEEVEEEDAAEEDQNEATEEESSKEAESEEKESEEDESKGEESETEESKDAESEEEQAEDEESEEGESEDKTEEKSEEAETKEEDSESKESDTEDAAPKENSEEVKDAGETAEEAVEAADDTKTTEKAAAGADAEDEKSEEKAEEEDAEEKLIKVTYEATEGGSVSSESEEVDINDEDAEFEGSTATADDGYVFVNWTDADGEEVSDDVTFVPEDLEEDATFTANFEEEEVDEEETEKNVVKITYKATEGGKVSPKSEKYDLNAKDAELKGSTAEAEEGYVFVNWTDEDGKEVSDEVTFVPEVSDFEMLEKDAEAESKTAEYTYTANFEAEGPTYEMKFVESTTVDGIEISFYAAKEVLPDDVRFTVDAVSSSEEAQIADMIEDDLNAKAEEDAEVEVKTTKSFDINFYADSMKSDDNPDGKVQPKDGTVRVTFDAISNIEDEVTDSETSLAVYHVEDDMSGVNQEKLLENATVEEISFEAEHFSTYTIAISIKSGKDTYKSSTSFELEVKDTNGNLLHVDNATYNLKDTKEHYLSDLANKIKITDKGVFEYSKATIENDQIYSIKAVSYKSGNDTNYKVQYYTYSRSYGGSWSDLGDKVITFHFVDKTMRVTAKVVDTNYNEIASSENFAVVTEDDLEKIKPSQSNIVSGGGNYSYVATVVYDSYYHVFGEVQEYEIYNNNLYAWYGDGSYEYGILTGNDKLYFVYENLGTEGKFSAQVTDYYNNELADPIEFTIGENFNVSDIKPAENDIFVNGNHYEYEKAQVKYGSNWYDVTDFELSGDYVTASFTYGYSINTARLNNSNFRFRYKKVAPNANSVYGHHLDLGFKDQAEFKKYRDAGATIKAVVNGKSYDMHVCTETGNKDGYDEGMKTYEYRLSYGDHGQRFNITDKVIFQLVYNGQTYEIDATSYNAGASKACQESHPKQSQWGFDYVFSFEDQFEVVGNLIYNKNDGSTTMPVTDTESDTGVDSFTFKVNDISTVGFMSGPAHKDAGYTFKGWSYDEPKTVPDITLDDIKAGTTITVPKNDRKELYAVWERLSYPITYLDGYNVDGQNQVDQFIQNHGEKTKKPANPTRDFYVFDGWYVTGDVNKNVVEPTSIPVTGPASYTAKWTRQYPEGQISISAVTATKTYNGDPLKASYNVTGKPAGFDDRFEVTGVTYKKKGTEAVSSELSITDAGSLNYEIVTYRIVDKQNNNADVTEFFKPVLSKDGSLTVNPVEISVTTGTQSWKYDGQAHRNYDITYNGQKLALDSDNYVSIKAVKDETIKLRTKTSVKYPGIDVNKDNELDTYVYTNGAKAENYDIKVTKGKLSITVAEAAFKIKAQDQTFIYDGNKKTHDVVELVSKPEGYENYTVEANVTADSYVENFNNASAGADSITVANKVDRDTIKVYTIIEGKKNDVTGNFDVSKIISEDGTLTLKKRQITIKSGSGEKEYDGQPLQVQTVGLEEGSTLAPNQKLDDLVTISNYASVTTVTPSSGVDNTYDHVEKDLAKNYKITYQYGKLKITQKTASIKITARTASKKYDGTALVGNELKDENGNSYKYDLEGSLASGDRLEVITSGTITNVGTTTHKIDSVKVYNGEKDVTSSYLNIVKVDGKLSINPRTVILTSHYWEKEYDGTPLTNASGLAGSTNPEDPDKGVTITWPEDQSFGFVEGQGVDAYQFTGSQTLVGNSKNAFTYTLKSGTTEGKNGNYIIVKNENNLVVTGRKEPYVVKLKANSDEVTYNGQNHSVSGFVSEYEGHTFENTEKGLKFSEGGLDFYITGISASLTKKDVQHSIKDKDKVIPYTVAVNGTADVKDAEGNIVTEQFEVSTEDGSLLINPRNVTLTSASGSKEYDGTALTSEWLVANNKSTVDGKPVTTEVVVSGDGFADGEGATYTVTGSQTYVGGEEGNNDFTYTLKDNTKAGNYNITTVDGTLTVIDRSEKYVLKLTANSREEIYNGDPYTVSGFETTTFTVNGVVYVVTGLESKLTETDVNYNTTTNKVESYAVPVTGKAEVHVGNANGQDVTSQFDVQVVKEGTLLIKQRNVVMTSASGEKEYDGTALTSTWLVANNKATVEGNPVTTEVVVSGDGFAKEEGATYTVTGSQTRVGGNPGNNTFSYALNNGTKESNYNITTVNGTLKVTSREQKYDITVTAKSGTFTYDGTEHAVSGFITGEGTPYTETAKGLEFYEGKVKYYVAGISANGSATNVNDAGVVEITGELGVFDSDNVDVTDQFDVTTVNGKITIDKRKVFLKSSSWEKEYDGTALTNVAGLILNGQSGTEQPLGVAVYVPEGYKADEIGFVSGQGATYAGFTGTVTLPGDEVENVFNYSLNNGTEASNYDIEKTYGTLKVNGRQKPYEVKLVANSKTEKYNGSVIEASGFDPEKSSVAFTQTEDNKLQFTGVNGVTYYISGVTANGSGTDVTEGGYTVTATKTDAFKVTNEAGTDLTTQFNVIVENGLLTITKRDVTLTSADWTKEYDGTALTNATGLAASENPDDPEKGVKTSGDGFVEGEGVTYTFTGSQTYVGGEKGNNDFTYTLKDNTKAENYNITTVDGTLSVTNRTNKYQVKVKANSGEFKYDGDEHPVSGFVTTEAVEGRVFTNTNKGLQFTENGLNYYITGISASKTETDVKRNSTEDVAGSYDVTVEGSPVVKDEDGIDVTAQFEVSTENGTLTINPRTITLTAVSGEKEYDGTPLDSKWLVDNKKITADKVVVQTGDGFAKREGFKSLTTQGSALVPNQTAENVVVYILKDDTKGTNYNINKVPGNLHIINRDAKYKVTVYAAGREEKYDGTPKSVTGFDKVVYDGTDFKVTDNTLIFTLNGQEFTVSGLSASGATATDVMIVEEKVNAAGINSITGTAVVKDAAGNDVSGQFEVSVV